MSRSTTRIIAVVLATCLVAIGCGNSNSSSQPTTTAGQGGSSGGEASRDEFVPRPGVPGVSDKEISYDVIGTKTGNPLGTCILDCYVEGIEAYFAYRNSQGGIYGRNLVVGEVLDDELVQNQQKALDVISAEDAFGVFSATLVPGGWGDLDSAGVPNYTWGIHAADSANRTSNFPSLVVRCPDCLRRAVPFVAAEAGATKAASLGYGVSENSKVCTSTFAEAFDRYEQQSGVDMVYSNADLQYGLPNGIGPQVSAMKAEGVDFISTCIDLNGMKTLAQELQRQGMDDVVLYHPNSYDPTFVKESAELFEGDVVVVGFRPLEASPEGNALAEFQTWMEKQGSTPSELAMTGWLNASLAFEGLLRAGPEFDRASVIAATNAITDWTAGGLLQPVDWSTAHVPYTADEADQEPECVTLVRIQDGAFVPYASAEEPWLCFDGDDPNNFKPTPTNFG
jgi:ABC-type branched-subunit amino acid transport system substrate-binding protein